MISKGKVKQIRLLENRKARDQTGFFVAEGNKICLELLASEFTTESLYFTSEWELNHSDLIRQLPNSVELIPVTEEELRKISSLSTPNQILAVARKKQPELQLSGLEEKPVICLDHVQDPGNLGTIIRTADWFGFTTVICSPDTVDIFNPKVIQASMGSVFRINYFKYNLEELLNENLNIKKWPVYATVLDGKNIYNCKLSKKGFYLFGNEANGVSKNLQSVAKELITIPKGIQEGDGNSADSLNIAIATAIVMAEIRRQFSN